MSKILIVEDDISLRDVYSARLEAEGYQIVVAANGEEALAIAVKERPDLMLLDVMMPKISGFDVLDIIRTTPEIAHTRVIMMTALSAQEDRERGEKLGVDKYLVKSQVTLEEVVSTIKTVLGSTPPEQTPTEPVVGSAGQRETAAPQVAAAPTVPPAPDIAQTQPPQQETPAQSTEPQATNPTPPPTTPEPTV